MRLTCKIFISHTVVGEPTFKVLALVVCVQVCVLYGIEE